MAAEHSEQKLLPEKLTKQTRVEVDIQWTKVELESKQLPSELTVHLTNRADLTAIPADSAVCGDYQSAAPLASLCPIQVTMCPSMSTLTEVGAFFLRDCSSIQVLGLGPLVQVEKVGIGFLSGCSSLRYLELYPLAKVQQVADGFLEGTGLRNVDLAPLINLQKVGSFFLGECRSLQAVDLNPLVKLQVVGGWFLDGCTALKEVQFGPGLATEIQKENPRFKWKSKVPGEKGCSCSVC